MFRVTANRLSINIHSSRHLRTKSPSHFRCLSSHHSSSHFQERFAQQSTAFPLMESKSVQGKRFFVATSSPRGYLFQVARNFSLSSTARNTETTTGSDAALTAVSEAAATTAVSEAATTTTVSEAAATTAAPSAPSNELVLDFLPEKPTPLPTADEVMQWVGDPPLETLGLATWWPSGRVQYILEYLHVNMDLPWWGAIAIITVCLRLITFPLAVKTQRNAAHMNNINPKLMELQNKMTDARRRGDMYDVVKYGGRMKKFMEENKIKPLSNFIPVLFQLPIFVSMFVGLRGMANLPLESMMSGGLFWFKDLTVADPYMILPALTSTTMYLQFKFAADGASFDNVGPVAKTAMSVLPFGLLIFTWKFPAAITFYWVITNIISVLQAKLIRTPVVRTKLGIPELIKWNKDNLATGAKKKGFREGLKDSWSNLKLMQDIADRRLTDQENFRKAGTGLPKRTYKFDPTKPKV